MTKAAVAPPATLVIFGAQGDLTKRLLLPAIVNLARSKLLSSKTEIIGISHYESDDEAFRASFDEAFKDDAAWARIRQRVRYLAGDFADADTFRRVGQAAKGDILFYLATAPNFFGPIVDNLSEAGLLDEKDGFRRIVIEKPFGIDLASARALNHQVLARAQEAQIYRIDHFVGKETVQNILVARFGNALLEAVWNNRYIDYVEITAAETVSVGTRGKFYDATGALRDMVPSHLFQLLAMIGMEPPISFEAEAIRSEKAKVIAAIRPIPKEDAVRGRYESGVIGKDKVEAYLNSPNVERKSRTETYVALKLAVDTWRWSGVPFYLRTGKALSARDTEIVVHFRAAPLMLFREACADALPPNRLVLQIQPDERISLDIAVKTPGPIIEVEAATMDFAYPDRFAIDQQTGYETPLYDALTGDQTLFPRADQIEAGWQAVQPVLDAWTRKGQPESYAPGSAGPAGADALLARDGRAWHPIG